MRHLTSGQSKNLIEVNFLLFKTTVKNVLGFESYALTYPIHIYQNTIGNSGFENLMSH